MPRFLVAVLCLFTAPVAVHGEVFKCKGPTGPVFQDRPCAVAPQESLPRDGDVQAHCEVRRADRTDYLLCAAEFQCDYLGAYGASRSRCIDIKHERMLKAAKASDAKEERRASQELLAASKVKKAEERAALEAKYRTDRERELREAVAAALEPVDCTDLSIYAKNKGHWLMERAQIVRDAKEKGLCVEKD